MAVSMAEANRRLRAAVKEMVDRIDDLSIPFAESIEIIERNTRKRLSGGKSVYNRKFIKLNERYAKRKSKKHPGKPTLVATGNMTAGINIRRRIGKQEAEIEWMTDYGVYHQEGEGKLPKRPWVGITKEDEREIDVELEKFMDDLISKVARKIG